MSDTSFLDRIAELEVALIEMRVRAEAAQIAYAEEHKRAVEAEARLAELAGALELIRVNLRGDVFVDEVKRGMYMAVIEGALTARSEGKDEEKGASR